MDELTLGLIGAGAVVVGGVVVYNAWQGAKVRRKMPRPMPAETAESFARDDQEEQSPFIEPARPTTRREPVVGTDASAETTAARVEPTFGGSPGVPVAPLDTPADIQAEGLDRARGERSPDRLGVHREGLQRPPEPVVV